MRAKMGQQLREFYTPRINKNSTGIHNLYTYFPLFPLDFAKRGDKIKLRFYSLREKPPIK